MSDPLVTLRPGAPGAPPVVCVPGAGEGVVNFLPLAGLLDSRLPWIGLQPCGQDGTQAPHASMSALVACFLQSLLAARPEGPVHLVGHAFGGWIAFEMALQFQAAGRPVASLTLLNSMAPGAEEPSCPHTREALLRRWLDTLDLGLETPLGLHAEDLANRPEAEQLAIIHARLAEFWLVPRNSRPDMLRGPIQTFAAGLWTPYHPAGRYSGAIHLILANDPACSFAENREVQDRTLSAWRPWAGEVRALHAPGNVMTQLMPPHVAVLAAWLRPVIRAEGSR